MRKLFFHKVFVTFDKTICIGRFFHAFDKSTKLIPSFHKCLLLTISISFLLFSVNAECADKWMEGTGASPVAGTDSVSDLDSLIDASIVNPLDRLLSTYINGVTLVWTDANTITVGVGEIVCSDGSVQRFRKNTSTFTIDLSANSATAGVDEAGDVDKASSWFHVYANADADATTFTGTASLSESAPTGVTYYKYIGSVYNDASADMLAFFWQGDGNDIVYTWDSHINITTTISAAWSAATDCSAAMPFSSELGIFNLRATHSENACTVCIRPNGSTGDTGQFIGFGEMSEQVLCATDGSQQIQYQTQADDVTMELNVKGFVLTR